MSSTPAVAQSRRGLLLVGATGGIGALFALLPTLALQAALVAGAAVVAGSVLLTRAGRILNPAWLIVAWLYLLGPLGRLLSQAGIGLPTASLVLIAPVPFVVAALLMRPQSLQRLVRLAPLGILLALAGLSLMWSPDPSYGFDKLSLWVLVGVLPAACILILAPGTSGINWRLIAGAAFLYALALLMFGEATPLSPGRATILDANPIWAARAVFVGALVVLFGPVPWLAKVIALPVMIAAGLTTVSLGPAVGLVVGAWAGVGETLRCGNRRDPRVAAGWVAFLLVTGIAVVVYLSGVLDPILSGVASDPNTSSRAAFLGESGRLFLQAPVLGIGIGGFAATGIDLYPHNMVAEVGSELGALGSMLLLAWLGLALRGAARSPILVSLVVATAMFSLFSGSVAGNSEFWMFTALAVAMIPVGRSRAVGSATAGGR